MGAESFHSVPRDDDEPIMNERCQPLLGAAMWGDAGVGKVVLTMLRGGRRTGVPGYCWGSEPGSAPHRRQAGGGWS
jgi:hypothetical protein